MAITNIKRQEETANQTAPVASKTPYTGLQGVSQNTAANWETISRDTSLLTM